MDRCPWSVLSYHFVYSTSFVRPCLAALVDQKVERGPFLAHFTFENPYVTRWLSRRDWVMRTKWIS